MAIKVYRSDQAGAPTLNGVQGALITVLNACLCDGYGGATIAASNPTRVGSTATCVTSTAHGFSTGDSVTMAGCTEPEYNGEFVVTVLTTASFTYTVSGTPSTPATGSPTCKRAPGGYTKVFTGTNKGVFRANDANGTRFYLRILDDASSANGAKEARLWGYETMSDVDSGTGLFPTVIQFANSFYLTKSNTSDSVARAWTLITDGFIFYFFSNWASTSITDPTSSYVSCLHFGDIKPTKAGDAYRCVFGAMPAAAASSNPYNAISYMSNTLGAAGTATYLHVMARDWTGIAGARLCQNVGLLNSTTIGGTAAITYPHGPDNAFYMTPVLVVQSTPVTIRGTLPGVYEPYHGAILSTWDTVSNVQGYSGRTFLALRVSSYSTLGLALIDITGPW